jgi:ATP-dependent 26S proteasome regulatory subunit
MGIKPPKGVILYGVPGTGKTLLAKAVANQTSATFLRVVGSELIQKYLGDGPKLVREMFRLAEEHAPSIVFIDEIDAIGTKRYVLQPDLFYAGFLSLYQDTTPRLVVNVKYSGRCWSFSIN